MSNFSIQAMKEKTRNKILDVALQLCQRQSLWALKIDDIVKHSHLSRATFYNYFKSKDDLIFTLFEHELQKKQKDILASLKNSDDIRENLKSYLRQTIISLIEFAQSLNIHIEEIQVLLSIPKKKMDVKKERDIRIIGDILKQGVNSGDFVIDDLDMTAHLIWIVLIEIGKNAVLENSSAEKVEKDIDQFLKVLFFGITGTSSNHQKQSQYHQHSNSHHTHLYDHDSGTD
jgi:AcrR family transcriptional regulator